MKPVSVFANTPSAFTGCGGLLAADRKQCPDTLLDDLPPYEMTNIDLCIILTLLTIPVRKCNFWQDVCRTSGGTGEQRAHLPSRQVEGFKSGQYRQNSDH